MAWLGRFDDFGDASHFPSRGDNVYKHGFGGKSIGASEGVQPRGNHGFMTGGDRDSTGGYVQIRDITCNLNNVSIIGVIISKDGPRSFVSKKGTGTERHLIAFTVRDSPDAFVNVTCWGGESFVHTLAQELVVGDVVDIKKAQVQSKSNNPADEKFKPWTPCDCQLSLSDNNGTIVPYSGFDIDDYDCLINIPTRPNNDFHSLEDILANDMNLQGEHVNILAVVRKIWPVKEILTKFGKSTSKCDVILIDETCPSFRLTLWDNFVQLAESWTPLETVIFAADVKVSFNEYVSSMVASTDSKTIFTVNPNTQEAECIRQYSKTHTAFLSNNLQNQGFLDNDKDLDDETVMSCITVREAKMIQDELISGEDNVCYGVLFAVLTTFDIDGDAAIFRNICSKCRHTVQESTGFVCGNPECTGGDLSLGESATHVEYSFSISLSDHTGTLDFCHVPPFVAEQMLGAKATDFKTLEVTRKTLIKWNYLMERVKANIKIKRSKSDTCFVRVLSLERASPEQIVEVDISEP